MTIDGGYGIYKGPTVLKCEVSYNLTDASFDWGNRDSDGSFQSFWGDGDSSDKYTKTDDDLSSKLTIGDTLESDLRSYTCQYGSLEASIDLTTGEIEGKATEKQC